MDIRKICQIFTVTTTNRRNYKMEAFGILGFIFGIGALSEIIMLEKQLKESGVLKEQTQSDDK